MIGLSFCCCFFFGLPFQLLQFLRYLELQAVLPFQQVKKKVTYIYINISLAHFPSTGLHLYFNFFLVDVFLTWTMAFTKKERQFIIYRNLTSNVCIRFGLIVSFMRTVSAPPTPWNSRKKKSVRVKRFNNLSHKPEKHLL